MESDLAISEALSKCAGVAELEELKDIQIDQAYISALQSLLLDVYALLRPRPSDYENRSFLIQVIKKVVADTFGSSSGYLSVEAYGSFVMDLFTARSDLDLTINFSNGTSDYPRDKKVFALRKLTRVLGVHQRNGVFKGLSPILQARVPIVRIVDHGSEVECDISVESKDGVSISQFFRLVSSIDGRFQILCYLTKLWAKAHGINCARNSTMNSLSIVTLVAFHLQTRKPPIFPRFSSLLKDGLGMSNIERNVIGYRNFGRSNQESVAELFITFFVKLASVNHLWEQGICASSYEGRWIYKLWKSGRGKMSVGGMSVEDFMTRSQNFARCVGKAQMNTIAKCIADSLVDLSFFMRGQIDASRLKKLLFKSIELDSLGKPPVQKLELSRYPSVVLTDKKPKKKKGLKNKGKKASREVANISNNKNENIRQKRRASSIDYRASKKAREAEPSRVSTVLLTPTPSVIPPVLPGFGNVSNRAAASYVLSQPCFVPHQLHNHLVPPQSVVHQLHNQSALLQSAPHQLHNQVFQPHFLSHQLHNQAPLPEARYVRQPLQHPLAGQFLMPLHTFASPHRVRNQHHFVPHQNPTRPRAWNGDPNQLYEYHR